MIHFQFSKRNTEKAAARVEQRLFATKIQCSDYCEIASTGQTGAQAPQSMQAAGSISYLEPPAEMQLTGHSAAQTPQLMQLSLIT